MLTSVEDGSKATIRCINPRPVDTNMQGVVGFMRIDYQGPGRTASDEAWNLQGGGGSEVSSEILIRKPDENDSK